MARLIWSVDSYFRQNGKDGFFIGRFGSDADTRRTMPHTPKRNAIRALDFDEAANFYGWRDDEGEHDG